MESPSNTLLNRNAITDEMKAVESSVDTVSSEYGGGHEDSLHAKENLDGIVEVSQMGKDKSAKDHVEEEICPFVCGICSQKFDRVSAFYSHVRTHEFFSEMDKKNKILDALDVKGKDEENFFTCGICQIEFPSMSLLHDHMVNEENTLDYSYSNVDHTARPEEKFVSGFDEIARNSGKEEKRRSRRILNNAKVQEENETSSGKSSRKKQKRKVSNSDEVSEDDSPPKSKNIKLHQDEENPQMDDIHKTVVHADVLGNTDLLGDENASSRRSSRRSEHKRINYKVLAGIETRKTEQPVIKIVKLSESKSNKSPLEPSDDQKKAPIHKVEIKTIDRSRIKKIVSVKEEPKESSSTKCVNSGSTDKVHHEQTEQANDSCKQNEESLSSLDGTMKVDGTDTENEADYAEHDSDDDFEDYDEESDMEDLSADNHNVKALKNRVNSSKSFSVKVSAKILQRNKTYKKRSNTLFKNCLYPCKVCGRYFNKKALKKHMYAHVQVKVVQCELCGKYYKSKRHLSDHTRSVHKMVKYKCTVCGHMLKGKQSFEQHVTVHILKQETELALEDIERIPVTDEEYTKWKEEMDAQFPKSSQKKKKKKTSVVDRLDEEDESGTKLEITDPETIKAEPIYGEHFEANAEMVGTAKNVRCKICKENFSTHEMLIKHMLTHETEEQYSCSLCKAFFQTVEHLNNHMLSTHGDRDLECDICGSLHKTRYALWAHKGKHMLKKDKYYSEEVVQKLQEEIKNRRRKAPRIEHNQIYTTCELCGMKVRRVRLKRHLEVHTETKDWQCDVCKKFYKTRRYLIDHQKKTHQAGTAKCDICGQTFKGSTYLDIHKQTHGPRDKECPDCGKGFTTAAYLRTHMQTHEIKKRFKCSRCPAAFSHKQRFQIHMVEVHGDGPSRPCKYCGDLFPSRQRARQHERSVHEYHVKPVRKRKKPYHVHVLPMNPDEILANKSDGKIIPVHMISKPRLISQAPGGKVILRKAVESAAGASAGLKVVAPSSVVEVAKPFSQTVVAEPIDRRQQMFMLEKGDTIQLMIEKGGDQQSLEYVELTEEEQNLVIREAQDSGTLSFPNDDIQRLDENVESVEQILEIPENAEQCQILLYPDGSFKLLNVVDKTC